MVQEPCGGWDPSQGGPSPASADRVSKSSRLVSRPAPKGPRTMVAMASLRALEARVTIVEQEPRPKAAALLPLSQPALSHQIAAIERELGTPVIERLPRGIRPTAAGLASAAEARGALAAADRAVIAGRRAAAGAGGRIRIACTEAMTAWVLVPVLRAWRHRFPDVALDLTEYTSADQML